jgi:hypothetical protein
VAMAVAAAIRARVFMAAYSLMMCMQCRCW